VSSRTAFFRFYEELNDFLPYRKRKRTFPHHFDGSPAVKDAIEAEGAPHTEVDLILVNGRSVDFGYSLRDGDRVAVYPVFESFDISPLIRLREKPLRKTRFVLDVHLGKLARHLRLLGFDTRYRNDFDDPEIIRIAAEERRIILTRDIGILKRNAVTHGYWLRSTDPEEQVREVLKRFDLHGRVRPFHRCTRCNGLIEPVDKAAVRSRLEPRTERYYDEFFRCTDCGRIYWKGSHFQKMIDRIDRWTADRAEDADDDPRG
jgi:uncharacterized protein